MTAQQPSDLHRLFAAALNSGDADAVLELYEEDATLVPSPGGVPATGKAAIREALSGFLALKPNLRIDTVSVIEGGLNLALLSSRWVLEGTGPDGSPVELRGTSSEVARRHKNGNWLYAVDDPGVGR